LEIVSDIRSDDGSIYGQKVPLTTANRGGIEMTDISLTMKAKYKIDEKHSLVTISSKEFEEILENVVNAQYNSGESS
jgi:hypothetical protein